MPYVSILLDRRAIDVLGEISKEGRSDNPIARAIVDNEFGIAALLTVRPQDTKEERTLLVHTTGAPSRAVDALWNLPGVEGISARP
ncbi:MAG: hypothetical protein KGI37_03370 [Alphaproteobacteria bacterium]|nr:hypothetical protein [Alphaproteobacteria bacterium]